jgi:hypothetical protein
MPDYTSEKIKIGEAIVHLDCVGGALVQIRVNGKTVWSVLQSKSAKESHPDTSLQMRRIIEAWEEGVQELLDCYGDQGFSSKSKPFREFVTDLQDLLRNLKG